MTKIFPHCTISVGLAPLADYSAARHVLPIIIIQFPVLTTPYFKKFCISKQCTRHDLQVFWLNIFATFLLLFYLCVALVILKIYMNAYMRIRAIISRELRNDVIIHKTYIFTRIANRSTGECVSFLRAPPSLLCRTLRRLQSPENSAWRRRKHSKLDWGRKQDWMNPWEPRSSQRSSGPRARPLRLGQQPKRCF